MYIHTHTQVDGKSIKLIFHQEYYEEDPGVQQLKPHVKVCHWMR